VPVGLRPGVRDLFPVLPRKSRSPLNAAHLIHPCKIAARSTVMSSNARVSTLLADLALSANRGSQPVVDGFGQVLQDLFVGAVGRVAFAHLEVVSGAFDDFQSHRTPVIFDDTA